MAVGFTPQHTEECCLNDLSPGQFLALCLATAEEMNWQINFVSASGLIAFTNKGIFSWNASIKIIINADIAAITSESTGNEMMDFGKNKKNVERFLAKLEEVRSNTSAAQLLGKVETLQRNLEGQPAEEDILLLPPRTTTENIKDFFSLFIPQKLFFWPPILVNLNILVFVAMLAGGIDLIDPSAEQLLNWGGNLRPATVDGEWWRLITSTFLHGGIVHLVMNMFILLYIGSLLEPIIGRTKFILAYLLSGIVASITSISWHELTVSVGASGAIFGLFGVFLSLLTSNMIEKNSRKALLTSIGIFVGYNLIAGLKSGIDNAAHIGGLLTGMSIGFAYIPALKRRDEAGIQYIMLAFITMLVLTCSTIVYMRLPNNGEQTVAANTQVQTNSVAQIQRREVAYSNPEYHKIMIEFHSVRLMAQDIFPVDTTLGGREKSLSDLKDRGIYYWKRGIEILDSTEALDLPAEVLAVNESWRTFCKQQLKCYQLMYQAIDEHTKKYDEEINKELEISKTLYDGIPTVR